MDDTRPAEDEGIIDDVQEVIDDVLGENLAAPPEPDPWERRMRVVEALTAVILAVAAVATAWATFQASQWSGSQSDAVARSGNERIESLRASTSADQTVAIDTTTWLDWLGAVSQHDTARASFLRARFRPGLAAAHDAWVAKATRRVDGTIVTVPPGTPFGEAAYSVPERARAERLSASAEQLLASADEAATRSTRFVTTALVLALVLFFAGIATKFRSPRTQAALVLLSLVLLAAGLVRMLTLPQLL
jgi:hypothetical protein